MPLGGFFALAIAGVLAGMVYECFRTARYLFGNKVWLTVVLDLVCVCIMGSFFFVAEFKFLDFKIYGFGILAYILGIIIERSTLGFLLAKYFSYVYNWVKKIASKKPKTKLGKRLLK